MEEAEAATPEAAEPALALAADAALEALFAAESVYADP